MPICRVARQILTLPKSLVFVGRIRFGRAPITSGVRNRSRSRRIGKTKGNTMPTMPPEAANRPKPKVPYAENNFMDLPKPVVPKTENRKLLRGQKAYVTGASSGIGRSIALAVGHAGAAVCVNYVAGEEK